MTTALETKLPDLNTMSVHMGDRGWVDYAMLNDFEQQIIDLLAAGATPSTEMPGGWGMTSDCDLVPAHRVPGGYLHHWKAENLMHGDKAPLDPPHDEVMEVLLGSEWSRRWEDACVEAGMDEAGD
jgi:hypothetical protein